jgi:hypothetical protein
VGRTIAANALRAESASNVRKAGIASNVRKAETVESARKAETAESARKAIVANAHKAESASNVRKAVKEETDNDGMTTTVRHIKGTVRKEAVKAGREAKAVRSEIARKGVKEGAVRRIKGIVRKEAVKADREAKAVRSEIVRKGVKEGAVRSKQVEQDRRQPSSLQRLRVQRLLVPTAIGAIRTETGRVH